MTLPRCVYPMVSILPSCALSFVSADLEMCTIWCVQIALASGVF